MDYQEKKKFAQLKAKAVFKERFMQHMKSKNVEAFTKDFPTLYNHVIIPAISDQVLMADFASEASGVWEPLMMELIGEDGPGSVRTAIEKMKAESSAYLDEVMKQRETIKQMQKALRDAREFIISQSATKAAFEALDTVNQALSKSRNQ